MLMVRTPGYLKHLQSQFDMEFNLILKASASNKARFHKSYKDAKILCTEEEIENDRIAILAGNIKVNTHRNKLLEAMLKMGSVIGEQLHNMRWTLVETSNQYPFITSDMIMNVFNPLIPADSYINPGLGQDKSTVVIPISNLLTLMIINHKEFIDGQIFEINNARDTKGEKIDIKKLVKNLNKKIFLNSYKYVFADSASKKLKKMFMNISYKL